MDFRTLILNVRTQLPNVSVPVIKQHINMVYQDILGKQNWEFLNDSTNLTLIGQNTETDCVEVTNGSTTLVGTGTSFSTYLAAGYCVRIESEAQFYIVSSVTSDTVVVLEKAYGGSSDTDQDYTAFTPFYTMSSPSIAEIESIVYQDELKERPLSFFNAVNPERSTTGAPEYWRVVSKSNADGYVTIEIGPVPDQDYVVTVNYKKKIDNLSSDDDVPVFRGDLILAGVLKDLMYAEFTRTKNPAYMGVARDYKVEFRSKLREMILEDLDTASLPRQVLDSTGVIIPDNNYWTQHDVD